jgi:hypothetical protein
MSVGELRVPKQRVEVEVAFPSRAPETVEIFLAEHQARAFRRQDVLDLLEREHAFLPAQDKATGAWILFNKDAVLWVAIPFAVGDAEAEADELYDQRRVVRVELVGGATLEGEILYTAPAGHSRLADHLSLPGRFFRLWSEGRVTLVNKAFVLRVLEEESR